MMKPERHRKRKLSKAEVTSKGVFSSIVKDPRLHIGASVCALIFLPTLLLWSVTFGGKTLAPVDLLLVMSPWKHFAAEKFPQFRAVKAPLLDVVQQYFPWRKFFAETLRQGELPLWNPFMFCGTSFVGNCMSAIFYPLNLIFVKLPVEVAFGWVAWLHLILVGVFTFGFLRQFVSPLASLTGSISFQLCGFFVAWLAYLPLLCTAVWLPAALWAYEVSCRSHARTSAFVLSSLSLGMALLAGHPQIGFYVLWSFAVYVALRTISCWKLEIGDWKRSLRYGIFSLLLGVAVGAPQLLPLTEMARISFRSGSNEPFFADKFPVDQFIRLFLPSFFGDWRSGTHFIWDFARFNFVERTAYPGIVPFLLAFWGIAYWRAMKKRQKALLLSGVVFAATGLAAASIPTVHRYMALGLPGVQAFTGISRATFLFDFGIAVLCSVGIEALKNYNERFVLQSSVLALAVPLVLMAICVSHGVTAHAEIAFHPLMKDFTLNQIYRWLVLTVLGTFFILLASRLSSISPPRFPTPARLLIKHIALYALPFAVAVDLFSFAWGQNPEAEREMAFFETPSIRWLKRNLGMQRFIAVGTDAIKHWTPSNTLMVYRLRDAQGSDSLITMRTFKFLQSWDKNSPLHRAFAVRNFDSPLLDLMAVRYIVAAEPLSTEEQRGLRLVRAGDLWIYENGDALPRAFAVNVWQWVGSSEEALGKIKAPNLDLSKTAILEGERSKASRVQKAHDKFVNPTEFQDDINRLSVKVELSEPAALVIVDGAYPGWKVLGREAKNEKWDQLTPLVCNYAFRAVLLPPGKWQVVWVYFPSSVVVGLFLNFVAVSVMTALCVMRL
ncbi:MAG: hypothetical protein ACUVRR_01775 [Candidatus Fervidibacter sp.]|uniref:hypothetical protein n=1 Tax=Candidatus Fervidibacter sp. TaxID=3100871 RepID=UPI00404B5745